MANLVFDFLHHYQTGERRASDPADAYQYDEGHVMEAVVPVAVTSCEIHYWVRGQEEAEAYVPESITQNDDGSYSIIGHIPNTYFETYGELRVYIVVTDGTASITTYEGRIHICERSKPDDYVDDDPDNEAVQIIAAARGYAETSEAWAVGQINGEDVPSTADQYQNNASYYAAQAASAASSAAAQASLAPAYDNTATYEVGDYCLYSGQLYECTTAITTAEAWDSTHWTAVTVGGELSTVKDGLTAVESDVTDLKEDISHIGGLSEDIKQALLQIAEKVAYIDEDGQDYYDALNNALYPPADLVSISAVYTQSGTVYDTDSLDSLKSDLVVTAHMSDQTTRTVTEYTLSGTLAEGTSTITVTYGGKTTTFTVTVTEAPPYTFYDYLQGDGTAFLDTGLSAKTYLADSYKKYVKFRLGTIANEKCVFGARNGWGTTGVLVQINTATSDRLNVCFGNAWTKDSTPVANDLIELELDHPTIKKNGETLGTVSSASVAITSATATIPLFCVWGGSSGGGAISYNGGYVSQFFPYKIYRFTVTDKSNDTVIADMKPAMRVSDNAIGMYDTVRDEFYTNARGSGVLTLGNDEA